MRTQEAPEKIREIFEKCTSELLSALQSLTLRDLAGDAAAVTRPAPAATRITRSLDGKDGDVALALGALKKARKEGLSVGDLAALEMGGDKARARRALTFLKQTGGGQDARAETGGQILRGLTRRRNEKPGT